MAMICEMLNIPETYRAIPEKKKRQRRPRPDPSIIMVKRLEQLQNIGIPAELKYDAKTRSYFITARTSKTPDWNGPSAVSQWEEMSLC